MTFSRLGIWKKSGEGGFSLARNASSFKLLISSQPSIKVQSNECLRGNSFLKKKIVGVFDSNP